MTKKMTTKRFMTGFALTLLVGGRLFSQPESTLARFIKESWNDTLHSRREQGFRVDQLPSGTVYIKAPAGSSEAISIPINEFTIAAYHTHPIDDGPYLSFNDRYFAVKYRVRVCVIFAAKVTECVDSKGVVTEFK